MKVQLSSHHDSATCTWCERSCECVTATFSDGFLKESPLCWKCLQTAFKVRSQRSRPPENQETAAGQHG